MAKNKTARRNGKRKGLAAGAGKLDQGLVDLPNELWIIVAEYSAGDHALGSLAHFNVANKRFKKLTDAVLYETVLIPDLNIYRRKTPGSRSPPAAFRYTKFLLGDGVREEGGVSPQKLFPNLRLIITEAAYNRNDSIMGSIQSYEVLKPLSISTVFGVIGKTPWRTSLIDTTAKEHDHEHSDVSSKRWVGYVGVTREGSLRLDGLETDMSRFQHLDLNPQDTRFRFENGDLDSFWAYWTWMANKAAVTLEALMILVYNSPAIQDDECIVVRTPSARPTMSLSLSEGDLRPLLELLAGSLRDGLAKAHGYPNIGVINISDGHIEFSSTELKSLFESHGYVAIAAKDPGEACRVKVMVPKSTSSGTRKSFNIVIQ